MSDLCDVVTLPTPWIHPLQLFSGIWVAYVKRNTATFPPFASAFEHWDAPAAASFLTKQKFVLIVLVFDEKLWNEAEFVANKLRRA